MSVLEETIESALDFYSNRLAQDLKADVFAFIGGIRHEYLDTFRTKMERLAVGQRPQNHLKPNSLAFFLWTSGGSAEVVEKMVDITRHHYEDVWFFVPDFAMSAGTILCMSGDKIYMDYSSSLGPIDPQVPNNEQLLVPALGYLDQVERMIAKSAEGKLTDAEFAILQNQDLGTLHRYEQERELSISLLKDWLVKYKFKDWSTHSDGRQVTQGEKEERAVEIAETLSDHKLWHSHGRMIGVRTLTGMLRLKIEDYTDDIPLRKDIRKYGDLLTDCVHDRGWILYSTLCNMSKARISWPMVDVREKESAYE